MARRPPVAAPVVPIVHTCACGSAEIFASSPGTIAEIDMPRDGNVIPMHPAPEIPRIDWCIHCWPFSKHAGHAALQAVIRDTAAALRSSAQPPSARVAHAPQTEVPGVLGPDCRPGPPPPAERPGSAAGGTGGEAINPPPRAFSRVAD